MGVRRLVVAVSVALAALVTAPPAQAATDPELVSVPTTGETFPMGAHLLHLSPGAGHVFFTSQDTPDGIVDLWLRSRASGTTKLLYNRTTLLLPTISQNERYLAFVAEKQSVDEQDLLRVIDLTTRKGVTAASMDTIGRSSLSDDGRTIAFEGAGYDGPNHAVFVKNLDTGATRQITSEHAWDPVISGDGTHVAYEQYGHVYSKSLVTGALTRVDVRPDGALSGRSEIAPGPVAYSDNNGYLLFAAEKSDLADGTGPCADDQTPGCLFRRNFAAAKTTLASRLPDGTVTTIGDADLSGDGRVAAFSTGNNSHDTSDVYVRRFAAGTSAMANVDADGNRTGDAGSPKLNRDGSWVAFDSGQVWIAQR